MQSLEEEEAAAVTDKEEDGESPRAAKWSSD